MPKPTEEHSVQLGFTVSPEDFKKIKLLCAIKGCRYRELFLDAVLPQLDQLTGGGSSGPVRRKKGNSVQQAA